VSLSRESIVTQKVDRESKRLNTILVKTINRLKNIFILKNVRFIRFMFDNNLDPFQILIKIVLGISL